jgi:hypothetical protein
LDEYQEVLKRVCVRSDLIGEVVNLIRERAEEVKVRSSNFIVTLNLNDFPDERLQAKVVRPACSLTYRSAELRGQG